MHYTDHSTYSFTTQHNITLHYTSSFILRTTIPYDKKRTHTTHLHAYTYTHTHAGAHTTDTYNTCYYFGYCSSIFGLRVSVISMLGAERTISLNHETDTRFNRQCNRLRQIFDTTHDFDMYSTTFNRQLVLSAVVHS